MDHRARLVKRAATASVVVAVVLLVSKLVAWWYSDSVSVLSSLLDSLMDIAASGVNFIAIRYALMPADEDHPFGHSKAEGLAALVQSAFITGSAVALLLQVVDRLANPQPLQAIPLSLAVMGFSLLLTVALVQYQRWVVRQTQSLAVKADSAHYVSDILANLAVLVALLATAAGWYWLDPVVALAIVALLLHSVLGIVRSALQVLMDQALPEQDAAELDRIIQSVEGVQGYHKLRTRQAGAVQFIQLHLDLDGGQSLSSAHAIGDEVERRILAHFPRAEILIHHDPV
ncbi:cation-efflux pump FieF [Bacterioplanes sanyensis]|uniref:cation diffusion facilitator family transporter n=1 Tax=Bacterioplanes sanyensis TaxID=1249553 RepID=UPI0016758DAD|nr:cation diffusion facilitator family transporter [Bacterioplanes sanyensis]GGY33123.1 cation-efflux pump FieF [Bacterioplanes sanyensis]